jgi:hypothetical protein
MPEADPRSPEQVLHDRDWFGNHDEPNPADYRFELNAEQRNLDTGRLAEMVATGQEMLAAIGLPAAMGSGLLEQARDATSLYNSLNDIEQRLWEQGEKVGLLRHYGSQAALDEAQAAIETVFRIAFDGASPRAKAGLEALRNSPALKSGFIFKTLANWGLHVNSWASSRPKN